MQKLLGRYSALQILTYFVGAFPFFVAYMGCDCQ
jgi:hypothetical protein